MAEKAILVDTSKCIACRGCQVFCKQWNELPGESSKFFASADGYENPSALSFHTYNLIKFHSSEKTNGDPEWLFLKKQCMHCTDAFCIDVCPKKGFAMQRDEATGFVWVNRDECIGCRACGYACPFNIPKFPDEAEIPAGDGISKAYKCWACLDRVSNGREPACVKTCPSGAAIFGNRSAMVAMAWQRKAEIEAEGKKAFLYGIDEQGGLHYIYVLLREPSFYGLPSGSEMNSMARRDYLRYLKIEAEKYLRKVASF